MKPLSATSRISSAHRVDVRSRTFDRTPRQLVVPGWKRILDVSLVVVTAPVWVPLMLLLGAGIKLVSPGPLFFRQERVGLGEQKFTCLKLRSMHVNADDGPHQHHLTMLHESEAPMKKMDRADKRLIPGGWILRSTGLDELPQLINVLRGEMSLVGPRPCTTYEFEKYNDWQRERFDAAPSLTGLWQVSGKNQTTFTKMIELDIHYVRTSCVWLDLGIMFQTFPVLLGQFLDNRLERALLPAVQDRAAVNGDLKVAGVDREDQVV